MMAVTSRPVAASTDAGPVAPLVRPQRVASIRPVAYEAAVTACLPELRHRGARHTGPRR